MGIQTRTPQERIGEKRPEVFEAMHDQNSITANPSWLWVFNPDQPERKAALCGFWRDLMYPEEIALTAKVMAGTDLTARDLKLLERTFARMLLQCMGVEWADHPNAQRDFLR